MRELGLCCWQCPPQQPRLFYDDLLITRTIHTFGIALMTHSTHLKMALCFSALSFLFSTVIVSLAQGDFKANPSRSIRERRPEL